MNLDPELNQILKKMWAIETKIALGEALSQEEQEFFALHLPTIKNYYKTQNEYWDKK